MGEEEEVGLSAIHSSPRGLAVHPPGGGILGFVDALRPAASLRRRRARLLGPAEAGTAPAAAASC